GPSLLVTSCSSLLLIINLNTLIKHECTCISPIK
uniref:Uncharacterized protein n=1 Tax=Amphimedon queenslandica TaxID=400682 RepID=A0A1X7UL54_AMPQE